MREGVYGTYVLVPDSEKSWLRGATKPNLLLQVYRKQEAHSGTSHAVTKKIGLPAACWESTSASFWVLARQRGEGDRHAGPYMTSRSTSTSAGMRRNRLECQSTPTPTPLGRREACDTVEAIIVRYFAPSRGREASIVRVLAPRS